MKFGIHNPSFVFGPDPAEAFEGLNQAGYLKADLLVVLNDNEMAISPNVGAVSEWLSKRLASPSTARLKRMVKATLRELPHGQETIRALRRGLALRPVR